MLKSSPTPAVPVSPARVISVSDSLTADPSGIEAVTFTLRLLIPSGR